MSSSSTSASATDVEPASESASAGEVPRLSALFLIRFDKKVGYTLAWQKSSVDVPLDGAVEYKSLPSGLHAVKRDLVYFVHEEYAGVSAFVNGPADDAERGAQFVAVGGLVRLSYGRLGRGWLVAGGLEGIARTISENPDDTTPLEEFWEQQSKPQRSGSTPKAENNKGHSRARALSTVTAVTPSDQSLPPYHPARSIVQYIETFGPLVFRLQQAALLRKRILFVGPPPVRKTCEYVYNLSVLASIPTFARSLLPTQDTASFRLRSLFSLGVHDISYLESLQRQPKQYSSSPSSSTAETGTGWVACTTDEIIATKPHLYDIIVELPSSSDADTLGSKRRWPNIRTASGLTVKASQRDVLRWKLLHGEIWKWRHGQGYGQHAANSNSNSKPYTDAEPDASSNNVAENDIDNNDNDDDTTPILPRSSAPSPSPSLHSSPYSQAASDAFADSYTDTLVESTSWSRLAYNGFMWWASAGESDAYTAAERERDRELVGDLKEYTHAHGVEEALIAYFHRWTGSLLEGVAEVVDQGEGGSESESESEIDLGWMRGVRRIVGS
ncbi:hypothetical protein K491DRAFT_634523 [Lophiostoma macrostomum CBS 122681]|uniref:DUF4484 domain-containing protein n=1 Tax=Lophiostoma macrostomum CBS 122681 TaxID=1314788 RepID=A0A6A6T167_9PLEO|nr:hypothetical protein K491DRAFT_634523 [Lophiostoma macrostomum CBS 122681]